MRCLGKVGGLFCLLFVFNCVTLFVPVAIGEEKERRTRDTQERQPRCLRETPRVRLPSASLFSGCFFGNEQGRKECGANGGISGSTGSTTVCKIPSTRASQYRAIAFFVSGTKERKTGVPGWLSRVRAQLLVLVQVVITGS